MRAPPTRDLPFIACVALAALVASLAPAAAEPARPVDAIAVLPFTVIGEKDRGHPVERAVCAAAAERLPVASLAPAGEHSPFACDGAAERQARYLLRGRVVNESRGARDGAGHDYAIEVELVDTGGVRAPIVRRDRCDICGFAEVLDKVTQATRALVEEIAPPPAAAAPAPVAPATPVASKVALAAPPPPAPVDRGEPRRRPDALSIGKWIGVAASLGLVATGAVMLAYDGRGTCDLPAGSTALCPRYYDTGLEGGLILGAGLAVAAGTAVLFWLDHRRAEHPRALVPTVTMSSGKSATLGLAGTF